jgi:putative ABC transport system permease protein
MFRREWRQQILVLVLLTLVVAAAVFTATAAYNSQESPAAQFGTANTRVRLESEPAAPAHDIATLERWFGPVEVIGHDFVRVPGSVERVDVRGEDPNGRYGAGMLRLRSGRLPARPSEVALTDGVASTFGAHVGDRVRLGRDTRTVVGTVENPGDLHDEFALVTPAALPASAPVTVLLDASDAERMRAPGVELPGQFERRRGTRATAAAAIVFGLAGVAMLLVCLVAAAGFIVIAQRRSRQLGLLAAVGATNKHLRLVMLANGGLVGVSAAAIGTVAALGAWFLARPALETSLGHRIAGTSVPPWLVLTGIVLAIATATAAAWWPARSVARLSVTEALSGRPAPPKPAHRSVVVAVVAAALGFAGVYFGVDVNADKSNVVLLLAGILALVVAIVFASPIMLRALARVAPRLPFAMRLALRDLGRYQARAGAAVAAISLGLAISVAIVGIASAAEPNEADTNLSDRQVLVRTGSVDPGVPLLSATDAARLDRAANELAAGLDHATVLPLDFAVDRGEHVPRSRGGGYGPLTLGRPVGSHTIRDAGLLYVATPALAARLGVDLSSVGSEIDLVTPQAGPLFIANTVAAPALISPGAIERVGPQPYSSAPRNLITEAALARHGYQATRGGWLIESASRLTASQLTTARERAAAAGLSIETRHREDGLHTLRKGATVAGVLLALAILAMTIGLIRSEAGRELRTLIATGAPTATRRAITASTAGALALVGIVLGVVAAYAALVAGYAHDLTELGNVPILELALTIVGLPLIAAAAGWLLAAREPSSLARRALD